MQPNRLLVSLPLAIVLGAAATRAQENLELGKMWHFEEPPLAYLKEEYGFAPSQEWLDSLRLASARFGNGCSSSFVSPKGLIMTNHHCVRGNIADVQGESDWVANGFYARALEDEVKIPDLTVQQVIEIRDVTAEVNAGTEGTDDASAGQRREANIERIVAAASGDGLAPQVVTLFQGAKFHLYVYKVWDDIRLVCSPHLQTAHFGGDFDNFTYPRWCLDFAFVRAYVDDKPADTSAHYFRWCTDGVEEDELVFVTGNPGTTQRLLTLAQMEYLRDVFHPMVQQLIDSRLEIREQLVAEDPTREKELRTEILSWENTQKAYRGYWDGLLDTSLIEQKQKAELAFKQRVHDDPEIASEYGDVWDRLAAVAAERREVEARLRFQSLGGHPVMTLAALTARALDGPEASREQFATRARTLRNQLEKTGIDQLAVREFVDHLERAQQWLPADDPWLQTMLGERSPNEVVAQLAGSALLDSARLDALLDGAGDAPDDEVLAMARAVLPLVDQNRAINERLTEVEDAQGLRIGRALFAAYGTSVSPDATLTLRFSDGIVKGFPYNGTVAPYTTSFYGLYAREHEFGGEYPFELPAIWLERKDRIDLTKRMCVVGTNDIIGGNSGSPLVNRDLEVVGLIFDGNIEMLANRYVYRAEIARSVSTHVDGIMEALQKVYEADRVVAELLGRDE